LDTDNIQGADAMNIRDREKGKTNYEILPN